MFFLMAGLSFAQSFSATEYTQGNTQEWDYYIAAADSGNTSGTIIKLNEYDGALTTYPLAYYLTIDTLSASGEILAVYIEGKMSTGSWVTVDTVLAVDTLNAAHAGYTDLKGVLDLNGSSWVFPNYRPKIVMTGASSNTCSVRLNLYAYKED